MKIYLDTCCYGRPYDDQSQDEIRKESKAILRIQSWCHRRNHIILGSVALDEEIGEITDTTKHDDVLNFYKRSATERAFYIQAAFDHINAITLGINIKAYDKLHLSFATAAGADYLLTTDKPFEKICAKLKLSVKVINPLKFSIGGMA
jgi:predicted nucleic acid-binding protein